MPENEDVARVYMATRRQVIIGGNRVIDINIMAIKTMMDLYEVKNQAECMERVRGLFYYFAGKK
jgi:predicted transcriptional regulator